MGESAGLKGKIVCPSFNENVCVHEYLTGTISLQKPALIGAHKDFLTFFFSMQAICFDLETKDKLNLFFCVGLMITIALINNH